MICSEQKNNCIELFDRKSLNFLLINHHLGHIKIGQNIRFNISKTDYNKSLKCVFSCNTPKIYIETDVINDHVELEIINIIKPEISAKLYLYSIENLNIIDKIVLIFKNSNNNITQHYYNLNRYHPYVNNRYSLNSIKTIEIQRSCFCLSNNINSFSNFENEFNQLKNNYYLQRKNLDINSDINDNKNENKTCELEKILNVTPITNYESQVIKDNICGFLFIELYIREKRRSKWELTNIKLQKIGKMRKCLINIEKYSHQCIKIIVESSNPESIKLSKNDKNSNLSNSSDVLNDLLSYSSLMSYSFYIIPVKPKTVSSIIISFEFPNGIKKIFHKWEFYVTGHKFESSKSGLIQKEQNKFSLKYNMFDNNHKYIPFCSDLDFELIDNLFLLKDYNNNNKNLNI